MYATDFKYGGKKLSDYNCIICDFDASSGASFISLGTKISFHTQSINKGKKYSLLDTTYDDCLQCTFDICKNPDLYDGDAAELTKAEYRAIARWLNRREFLKLTFLDCNGNEDENPCYYDASFNVSKIEIAGKVYGLRAEMTTNRPFGYGQTKSAKLTFTQSEYAETKSIDYISDEIGFCYPDVEIKCNASGTLSIKNLTAGCETQIKNCVEGETVTIKGNEMIISSSLQSHKTLCSDFNYTFLRLVNGLNSTENEMTASLPCEISIAYEPIIKDAP